MRTFAMSLIIAAALAAAPALALTPPLPAPVIPGYGMFGEIPDAFEIPDPKLEYKLLFDVSAAPADPATAHQGLRRVALLLNILGRYGVRPAAGNIAVIVHGKPDTLVLTQEAHMKRHGKPNPNFELIKMLSEAGVSIRLCGQSGLARGYATEEINPLVKVDPAAIITIATLQSKGYGLVQD